MKNDDMKFILIYFLLNEGITQSKKQKNKKQMDQTLGVLGFGFVGGWMGWLVAKSLYSNPVGQNSLTIPYLWPTVGLTTAGVAAGVIFFEQLIKTH